MKQSLHTIIINTILQDPRDRSFIGAVKKFMDNLPEDHFSSNPDMQESRKFINKILDEGLTDKREILYNISTVPYSTAFKMTLDDTTTYSESYKHHILNNLTAELMVYVMRPYVDQINNDLNLLEFDQSSKLSSEAVDRLLSNIDTLQQTSGNINLDTGKSNVLIMDPNKPEIDKTLLQTVEGVKVQAGERVKVAPPIDMLVGGGFAPDSITLFAAISGRGKSLVMHNIALYASKNNKQENFKVDGIPTIFFISLELQREKLLRRHLAWCGIKKTELEYQQLSELDIASLVIQGNKAMGLNLPIIYVERLKEYGKTNINDISKELTKYKQMGYDPVMVIIDYTDRMEVVSTKHASMGITAADGSEVLRQKCKECREVAMAFNVPVISAAQLSGLATGMMSECEPYYKYIDILHNFNDDWLAGSKSLRNELETLIFCHTFDISEHIITESGNDSTFNRKYLSMIVSKDRDNLSFYSRSRRDDMWESAYLAHLSSAKVGRPYSYLLKTTAKVHVVMPMEGFRMVEDDWGRSITMFYPDENAGKVEAYGMQASTISNKDKLDELYD